MFDKKFTSGIMLAANIALIGSIVTSSPVKAGMKNFTQPDKTVKTSPETISAIEFVSPFTGTKLTATQIESGFGIGRDIKTLARLIVEDLNDGKYKTMDVVQGLKTMDLVYSSVRNELMTSANALQILEDLKAWATGGDNEPEGFSSGFLCFGEDDDKDGEPDDGTGKGWICGSPCEGNICTGFQQEIVVNDFMQNLLDNMHGRDLFVQEMIRTNSAEIMQQVMEQMIR